MSRNHKRGAEPATVLIKVKLPSALISIIKARCPVCNRAPVYQWFIYDEPLPLTISCGNVKCWPVVKQIA